LVGCLPLQCHRATAIITLRTYPVNIFKKLGVASCPKAVLHALKRDWLTLDNLF
jgi:hypothetical protein